jgi:hypothetical protein
MQSTISEEYRQQQQKLHENPNYGTASVQFAPMVTKIINQAQVEELLDYGAGKMRLFQNIKPEHKLRLQAYDPAIPELSADPLPMQMVTCIDVLEHIEPELLDNVLDHLKALTLEIGFFTVHTGPAVKVLPDGRNAHLIQQPPAWWLPKILDRFELQTFQKMENGFMVVVTAKD